MSDPDCAAVPHQQTLSDKRQSGRSHSHSFIGLGRRAERRRNDSLGIQRQLWPNESLFEQGSIINQSIDGKEGLPKPFESYRQINLRDPVNECKRTAAFGFDTGHC